MPGFPDFLNEKFRHLDLRGKITAALLAAALPTGALLILAAYGLANYGLAGNGNAQRVLDALPALFLLIGACLVVGVLIFARIGARFISASLGEIAAAAETIAASGVPETRLPVRGDEFGRLSAAFNTMVERLRGSYADLEKRVAERTRDCEDSQHRAEMASSLLREAVQHVAVGFTIYDENDRLVMCNEAYLGFYEGKRDLIVPGASFETIVRRSAERGHYSVAGDVDAWVRQRVARHHAADGEFDEQRLSDGRWLLIADRRTPSGYIVGNRIDITELKVTSEKLRRRELYQRATLDNLPFLFWHKDAECRFLAVNKVFADACGRRNPDELLGLTDFDLWPNELAERYRADDLAVIASRREMTTEEPKPVVVGTEAGWIETYKKPVIADDGTLLGIVGFAHDISERRIAEAKIRDRNEQLDAIFALSPDGFVSFAADFRVKYASPAFLRMTGLSETEIVGLGETAFADLLNWKCGAAGRFLPVIPALHAQCAQRVGEETGVGMVTDSGMHRQLIELARPSRRVVQVGMRMAGTDTVAQILYFRDVTHETEVDRMKSEFLSTAAHELRTPMATIFGFSEVMLALELSEIEQREYLDVIHRQSQRMIEIINELLDLARIEARRGMDFNFVHLNLRALVQEALVSFVVPEGRAAPLLLSPAASFCVRADRKKLLQALSNVLVNAYKYSPAGGPVNVDLIRCAEFDDSRVRIGIRVIDRGIGMTPQQLERVCERFYRADASGKIPGTGLGMSIVKEIVEIHGGRIDLASEFASGSSVTLWIPEA
jgi:PAS domain S-box-containing protein